MRVNQSDPKSILNVFTKGFVKKMFRIRKRAKYKKLCENIGQKSYYGNMPLKRLFFSNFLIFPLQKTVVNAKPY